MSFALETQDLMEFIEGTDTESEKVTRLKEWKDWKKRLSKTSAILLSSVEQSLHMNLVNCTTPKKIWEKLHVLYGDMTEDAKQRCWQQFYDFRINDDESVATQIEKFETICKKLADAGETISDAAVMSKLLSSLPSKFFVFIHGIGNVLLKLSKKKII